jgi:ectoine hydroxylase-related dioxygenase (phytanoyl-CoA dioxygenase family)
MKQDTENQFKYSFDLNGYYLIENCIEQDIIDEINYFWDRHLDGISLLDIDFRWNSKITSFLTNPATFECIKILHSNVVKVDHAFAVSELFLDNAKKMHHSSEIIHKGIFYRSTTNKIYSSLTGVIFNLLPNNGKAGGFCCVPGSHNTNFSQPNSFQNISDNPYVKNIEMNAGDALIFTEALTHGTFPPDPGYKRRAIFIKYASGYLQYRKPEDNNLPKTPGYETLNIRIPLTHKLTDDEKNLIEEAAYYRGRKEFT